MRLKTTVEDQMAPPFCFFKNPLSWMAVLALFLVDVGFVSFWFPSLLLTSTVLVFSTAYFAFFSKPKSVPIDSRFLAGVLTSEPASAHFQDPESNPLPESENFALKQEEEEEYKEEAMNQSHEFLVTSPDSLSESECVDQFTTSEDSEIEWPFPDHRHRNQSLDYSDGSISDEESLIEIAIPTGHYVGHKEEDTKFHLQKVPDFSSDSIFKKHSLVELLADINNDMNEEENLIEIDISMGSIKYTRFEIEA